MRDYNKMSSVNSEDGGVKMTTEEINNQVISLEGKNRVVNIVQGGLSFGGSVAGLVYAIKKKKSFWGKVGYWILGGLIIGVPTGVGARLINNKRNTEIERLKSIVPID